MKKPKSEYKLVRWGKMKRLIPFLDAIIACSNEPDEKGCWNWQGQLSKATPKNPNAGGYGEFYIGKRNGGRVYAHHLSHVIFTVIPAMGKTPGDFTDKEILALLDSVKKDKNEHSHTCLNRRCVNPEHIVRESHLENLKRGGGKRKPRKLTDEQVLAIRRDYTPGTGRAKRGNKRELAKKYNVNPNTIWAIAQGEQRALVRED